MTIQQHASFDSSAAELNATSKLVKAWESKNAKNAAKAGGISLMALSLAACGGSSTPAISQADLDAKTAAASAAAAAQAAAEAEAAAAATAQAAAEAAQAAAEAEAAAAATAQAAAEAAQAAAEADAATAAEAQSAAEAAQSAAEAEAAAAAVAQAAAEAAQAAAEAEAAAAAVAQAAAEAAQAAAEAEAAALTSPVSVALTTSDDVPALSAGNDTITGTLLTYEAADVIVDGSSIDADTLTVTASGDVSVTPTVVKIETLNFDLSGVAAAGGDGASTFDVDVSAVRSAQTLNFDITSVGSSVTALAVDNVAAGGVTINVTSDFSTVTIDTVADADYTLNVGGATATTDITVSEDAESGVADDVTINSTSALSISSTVMDGDLVASSVGDMDVEDADSAEGTVTLTSSAGSVLVTTADGTATMSITAADEVDVEGATGVTTLTMSAAGTAATSATTASQVTATAMTTLNVSGNGAAVKVDASESDALATVNVSGAYGVEVVVDGDELTGISNFAFNDTSTAGTSVLNINKTAGEANVDLVDAGADVIKLTANMDGDDLDVATGALIQIAADQTATEFDGVYASRASNTISVTVNDDAEAAESWDIASIDFDNFATVSLISADTSPVSGGLDVEAIDVGTATLKVTGSGTFQFDSIVAGSFDGSEATGALDLDLEGTADVATVTTGSGNDTIVVTADVSTGGYTINAGAGNDGITLVAGADQTVDGGDGVDTATLDGDYTAGAMSLTSIEILELDHESVVDGSMLDGKALVVRDSTAAEGAADMIVTVDSTSTDLTNISVDSTTHTGVTVNGGTYGGFTGITVVGTNVANTITGGSNGDALTGGASGDTISGAAGADVISGLAGGDTLTGGAGGDTISGGAGGDTIFGGNAGAKESAKFDLVGSGDAGAIVAGDIFTMTLFGETITVTESAEAEQDLEDIGEAFVTAINTAFGDLVTVSDTAEAGTVVVTSNVDGVYTAFAATVAAAEGDAEAITAESTVEGVAGSDGSDIITGGEGIDLIFAGAGANTIDLSEAVAAADVVHFTEVGADVTTITGFAVNSDTLDFNGHESTDGEAVVSIAANASSANPTTGSVIIFADGADGTGSGTESVIADYTDLVDVAAFIEAGVGIATSETFIVMINDLANDNVYIYNLENDSETAAVASTDLDLIGIVSNIGSTALDANDIVA